MSNPGETTAAGTPENFAAFLDETIASSRKRTDRLQWAHNGVRLLLIGLCATLPALTSFQHHTLATVVAVLVVIVAGLDAQFKFGEQWQHHRSTQLALLHLKRLYEKGVADQALLAPRKVDDPFEVIFKDVEGLLQSEADHFWNRRVMDWVGTQKQR